MDHDCFIKPLPIGRGFFVSTKQTLIKGFYLWIRN
jgi:hypothetical protein